MSVNKLHIGMTGGIGTGKSRVAELFRGHGARVIDADQTARSLLEPGKQGWHAIKAAFGERFFNDDQTINRQKFRAAIFADHDLRQIVDDLLHPLIRAEIILACSKGQEQAEPLTVVEVPLLYEAGWQEDFDSIVVVSADDETCLSRIMARDGVSRSEAEQALAAQISIKEKVALADHLIDNSGEWANTVAQVDLLFRTLVVG